MTSFDSYSFWEEDYQNLESDFLKFIKYVPLSKEHEDVWSLKLVNQLLLIGSSIDSFFKCAMHSLKESYDSKELETEPLQKNLFNYKKTNMKIYRDIFGEYYKLSSKSVYVLRTETELKPFKEWDDGRSPEWWNVYTNLKHSRFENRKKATLKIVLDALSALFLLNIYHIDNRSYLVNKEIIRGNLNLSHNYQNFFSSLEPINTLEPIIAKTELFGYVWDTTGHWAQYPWNILDPGNVYGL